MSTMNVPRDVTQFTHIQHLNRAQKRAFILRDQLKYLDPSHLDTFLDDVGHPEPPLYQRVGDTVTPELKTITLRPSAASFDLGNIIFENGAIRQIHLTIADGKCEMSEFDGLPERDDELDSVPILRGIAKNILPLFQTKYKVLVQRAKSLNEARVFAYNKVAAQLPPSSSVRHESEKKQVAKVIAKGKTPVEGKQVRREPTPPNHEQQPGASNSLSRVPSEPVEHPSRKRKYITIDNISSVKIALFDNMPDQLKILICDHVVQNAFPNLDNLLKAASNVVIVHGNMRSEDHKAHKAILELKSVLKDFEEDLGKANKKARTEEIGNEADGKHDGPSRTLEEGRVSITESITSGGDPTTPVPSSVRKQQPPQAHVAAESCNELEGAEVLQKAERTVQGENDFERLGHPHTMLRHSDMAKSRAEAQAKASEISTPTRETTEMRHESGPKTLQSENIKSRGEATSKGPGTSPSRDLREPTSSVSEGSRSATKGSNHVYSDNSSDYAAPIDQRSIIADQPIRIFEDAESLEQHPQHSQALNNTSTHVSPQPPVNLGSSMLGAPKTGANARGGAPVAMMVHNSRLGERERRG